MTGFSYQVTHVIVYIVIFRMDQFQISELERSMVMASRKVIGVCMYRLVM